MKTAVTMFVGALSLLAPLAASAHDAKLHKGKQTKGEILAVAGDRLEMKVGKRNITVLLNEKPKIEVNGAEATSAALAKGQKVAVSGTTLATGEIVAKEVLVQSSRSPAALNTGSSPSGHSGHQH